MNEAFGCLIAATDDERRGLPDNHPRLLFKGGAPLSKSFGLINRFSEDIAGMTMGSAPPFLDVVEAGLERLLNERD